MTSLDKEQPDNIDIHSLVEQLKHFLGPNQNIVVMVTTDLDHEGVDFEVATSIEDNEELQVTLATYADLLDGDDEGVDEIVDEECPHDHDLVKTRVLQ